MPHCWIEEIRCPAPTPTEADVRIALVSQDLLSDQEAGGRLVGPRCHFSTTVEVVYPLRPLPRQPEQPTRLNGRVIIPEPCFWEPDAPFVYHGQLEVRQGKERWFETQLTLGLRTLQLRNHGLRLNGRPLRLQGAVRDRLTVEEGLTLRRGGCNLLVVPVAAESVEVWDIADCLGFLVIGQMQNVPDPYRPAWDLRLHPCSLGWLWPTDLAHEPARPPQGAGQFFGKQLPQSSGCNSVSGIDFIVCEADRLAGLSDVPRPKLVLCEQWPRAEEQAQAVATDPSILGWVRR